MDWMRRQDIKEESPETPTALTPDEPDECYFEEDISIDEGMEYILFTENCWRKYSVFEIVFESFSCNNVLTLFNSQLQD
ncbi:unnamed protein product [Heterotrigona itama]|uniref:Uncharacterized protein n=1 Tax=Heterotrigona itama TaxID=395501 RepID=A0A6V7H9F6_9HYME|nr:unnamed protein product [Heterotrigona itama]